MSELKACPFCGSKPEPYPQRDNNDGFVIWCEACGSDGPGRGHGIDAALAWNNRAPDQQAEIDRLKAEKADLDYARNSAETGEREMTARAEKAEADLQRMREALEQIANARGSKQVWDNLSVASQALASLDKPGGQDVKLTKAQRVFLKIANDLGGTVKVFPDQWTTASVLAAHGYVIVAGYLDRVAKITPAGRQALEDK